MKKLKLIRNWLKNIYWLTAHKAAIVLGGLAVLILLFGSVAEHNKIDIRILFLDLWSNVGSELMGIVITVWIIDSLNHHRSTNEEKDRLILQMGSPDLAFAREAVRILRQKAWLTDGTLQGKDFSMANLKETDLNDADLRGAWLSGAQLNDSKLINANLYDAWLSEADLRGANLFTANLQKANLRGAYLRSANLGGANLQGAKLERANLGGANLNSVICDETTILPDGTKWTPDIDLSHFSEL